MSIIIICIAAVVFMPFIAKIPVALQMHKLNGYDNKNPRDQQAKLSGFGARAMAAHNNCFEAISLFAPTILLVLALDEHTVYTVQLCLLYVLSRLLYLVFYWINWDKLRSITWLIGIGTLVGHYYLLLTQ